MDLDKARRLKDKVAEAIERFGSASYGSKEDFIQLW
jgi:hypothetical protein